MRDPRVKIRSYEVKKVNVVVASDELDRAYRSRDDIICYCISDSSFSYPRRED